MVSVPAAIGELRRSDVARAREVQMRVADQFVRYFSEGLVATRFEKTKESGNYLLTEWHFA
jgi:predicted GNAT superfamily acetyltransferase